uniref:Uncharacterized protein n=1 Tax=Setaria italica TaxID=4555 RepID=K4AN16_SETIT
MFIIHNRPIKSSIRLYKQPWTKNSWFYSTCMIGMLHTMYNLGVSGSQLTVCLTATTVVDPTHNKMFF